MASERKYKVTLLAAARSSGELRGQYPARFLSVSSCRAIADQALAIPGARHASPTDLDEE